MIIIIDRIAGPLRRLPPAQRVALFEARRHQNFRRKTHRAPAASRQKTRRTSIKQLGSAACLVQYNSKASILDDAHMIEGNERALHVIANNSAISLGNMICVVFCEFAACYGNIRYKFAHSILKWLCQLL
jgi:hypothetical protein